MKMSALGRQMLTELEGFKTRMYHDSAGLPTIGVGHLITQQELAQGYILIRATGQKINWREEISRDDVDAILEQDLPEYEGAVTRLVSGEIAQHQFDALVSFCFNVGEGAFARSTLLKMINAGNFDGIADQFKAWTKVTINGRKTPVRGLMNRRNKEIAMFYGELQHAPPLVLPPYETTQTASLQDATRSVVRSRQYTPNKWLMWLNPLDWFPGWGTYVSIAATAALYIADQAGYEVNPVIGGVLAAFSAARLRRSVDR
jgi:lysozyme